MVSSRNAHIYLGWIVCCFLAYTISGCGPVHRTVVRPTSGGRVGTQAGVTYKDKLIQRGSYHTVAKGDTVYRIAKRYDCDPQLIMRINKIEPSGNIEVGQMLFIPSDRTGSAYRSAPRKKTTVTQTKKLSFVIPVKGARTLKENIYYITPANDRTVRASESGTVTFGCDLKGYGQTVIIEHGDGFSTVYAHLDTINNTAALSHVSKGDAIASCYPAGSGQPMEFQLRRDGKIVYPEPYMANQ